MQGEKGAGVYVPDPQLGARLAPAQHALVDTLDYTYTLETDHAGFPNPEPWPSRIDIAVLGNSLLEGPGLGLDGELTALLEHRLGGRSALNFALPGAGTRHEYLLYRKYAEPLQPKVVVALLWVIWDIDNSLHFDRWLSENRPDPDFTHYRFTFRATHQDGPREVPGGIERVARFLHRQLGKSQLLWTGYRNLESLLHRQSGRERVVFPNGDTVFLSLREQERLAQGIDRPEVADMREVLFRPLEQLKTEVERQRWPLRRRPDAEQGRAVRRRRFSGDSAADPGGEGRARSARAAGSGSLPRVPRARARAIAVLSRGPASERLR